MDSTQPVLTRSQIDFFLREGHLTIERMSTKAELDWLRQLYDRIFIEGIGWEEGAQIDLAGRDETKGKAVLPQIMWPSKYFPDLLTTRFRANALAVARQILGPGVASEPRSEHMIFKPPQYGAETPWHQDQAYHDPALRYTNINFWMPLDDADEQNGCMKYVPRSHRLDVLPHHPIGHDPRIHGLEVDRAETFDAQAVVCPVKAGGATLHHSYLLHAAGPNTSDRPRRGYILVFALPAVRREQPLSFPWREIQHTSAMDRRAKTVAAAM